jgi:hypothetical protein
MTNLRYIENSGSTSGDRHLLMYNRDNQMVYELSYAAYSDGVWSAGYGAIFKLDSNYRRPEGWTSTDAAGLCVLAGLVRYDEVYGPDPIRHAIRCSIKRTNDYVYPASHEGASDEGAPPLGMRLRLKASVDISGYPAPVSQDLPGDEDLRCHRRRSRRKYVRAGHDGFTLGQRHVEPGVPQPGRE